MGQIKTNKTMLEKSKRHRIQAFDLLVIAASTGGPIAIKRLLQGIDSPFEKPVFIIQHMPEGFTASMAKSLSRETNHKVKEAEHDEKVVPGIFYLAPGGLHMLVKKNAGTKTTICLQDSPLVNGVRPAVDVLFSSIAEECPGKGILAVVLTGMGSDGVEGISKLKEKCNAYAIAQSERTSTVYGMPRSLAEAGYADEIIDLDSIAIRVQELMQQKGGT